VKGSAAIRNTAKVRRPPFRAQAMTMYALRSRLHNKPMGEPTRCDRTHYGKTFATNQSDRDARLDDPLEHPAQTSIAEAPLRARENAE
jgi:hypothetical protein